MNCLLASKNALRDGREGRSNGTSIIFDLREEPSDAERRKELEVFPVTAFFVSHGSRFTLSSHFILGKNPLC